MLTKTISIKDSNGIEFSEGDKVWCWVRDPEDRDEYEGVRWLIWGTDLQWQLGEDPDATHGMPLTWGGWYKIKIID